MSVGTGVLRAGLWPLSLLYGLVTERRNAAYDRGTAATHRLDVPVVSVSSWQNCDWQHFVQSGADIGEAIRRSDLRVVLLASGALSHKFNNIDWKPNNPRIFHESNVSRPENIASDKGAIALFEQGRHDTILERWDDEYRRMPWEAFGAHYLQIVGALGGASCRAKGEPLSAYENARGTGNIHIWFDSENQPGV